MEVVCAWEGMERESGGDAGLRSFAIHEQLNLGVEELSEVQLVLREAMKRGQSLRIASRHRI